MKRFVFWDGNWRIEDRVVGLGNPLKESFVRPMGVGKEPVLRAEVVFEGAVGELIDSCPIDATQAFF